MQPSLVMVINDRSQYSCLSLSLDLILIYVASLDTCFKIFVISVPFIINNCSLHSSLLISVASLNLNLNVLAL